MPVLEPFGKVTAVIRPFTLRTPILNARWIPDSYRLVRGNGGGSILPSVYTSPSNGGWVTELSFLPVATPSEFP